MSRDARRNAVLGLVLAGLIGADAALSAGDPSARPIEALAPAFDLSRAARVELSRGDAALALVREGESWVHDGPGRYEVLEYPLDELLARVAALTTADVVAESAASHGSLGVDAAGTRLVVRDVRGDVLADLVQGAAGVGSHVRRADADMVVRAPAFAPLALEANAWIDTTLLALDAGAVRTIRVAGEVELRANRAPDGSWHDALGRTLEPARVERLLAAVRELYFDAPLEPGAALERVVLTLELEDGAAAELRLGAPLGADHFEASSSLLGAGRVVSLRASTARLLEAAVAGLR